MTTGLEKQIDALLVASPKPINLDRLSAEFGRGAVDAAMATLASWWAARGMNVEIRDGFASLVPNRDTARALSEGDGRQRRRLSDAAVETLAFITFNQPVTVQDIESGRGVALSKGIIDSLLDAGFIRGALRKTNSGRALTYVTTDLLLEHYGLDSLADLPSLEELPELAETVPADDGQSENEVPQPHEEVAFGFESTNFSSVIEDFQSI